MQYQLKDARGGRSSGGLALSALVKVGVSFRLGQIGHINANGSPPLRRFFKAVWPRR